MKRLLLLMPFFLIGCTSDPTQIQDELEHYQYTKAVDLSTDQDEMNEPARLMVQLEQALASYRLQDVVTISKKLNSLIFRMITLFVNGPSQSVLVSMRCYRTCRASKRPTESIAVCWIQECPKKNLTDKATSKFDSMTNTP
ncbi:hypothetical protein [Exiguobacterium oxidotolerans]|uniref:hypothetical protein n=1 Tax=Exiguobacterium oxidotolerans TaxID=223958 RepID=UPI00049431D7|nr:hypothetical protein [Exiguobacterium oxidotolerans]